MNYTDENNPDVGLCFFFINPKDLNMRKIAALCWIIFQLRNQNDNIALFLRKNTMEYIIYIFKSLSTKQ